MKTTYNYTDAQDRVWKLCIEFSDLSSAPGEPVEFDLFEMSVMEIEGMPVDGEIGDALTAAFDDRYDSDDALRNRILDACGEAMRDAEPADPDGEPAENYFSRKAREG